MRVRKCLLLAIAVLLAAAGTAAAAEAPHAVFGLRAGGNPKIGYFVYELGPGSSRQGSVIVSNVGTATGTVRLFTTDATTGPTSGTVYRTDSAASGPGTWVKLAASSVALAAGASATVPFTVTVPASASSGQWVAGIAAESPNASAGRKTGAQGSVRIKVRNLTIVAVQVDVPGPPTLGFRIGRVATGGSRGYQQLLVHVAGTGNMLSRPRGSVVVSAAGGTPRQTLSYSMDTFLPRTSIDYPLLLRTALSPGRYTADIVLRAHPASGGPPDVLLRARRSFTVSSGQVKKIFSSAPPTRAPASGGSSWTTVAAAAGGAGGALIVGGGIALLLLRRRTARTS